MSRVQSGQRQDDSMQKNIPTPSQADSNKHLFLLTDRLEKMTDVLKHKSEEIDSLKEEVRQLKLENEQLLDQPKVEKPIDSRVDPLLAEIEKLQTALKQQQILKNNQQELDHYKCKFDALESAYVTLNEQSQQVCSELQRVQEISRNYERKYIFIQNPPILKGENSVQKSQLQYLSSQNQQLQQQHQQLIQQNFYLQQQNQNLKLQGNEKDIEEILNNYKQLIQEKQREINQLKSDQGSQSDMEIQKIKDIFEKEISQQKDISREMLDLEEQRVRRDEGEKYRQNSLTQVTKLNKELVILQEEKKLLERQYLKVQSESANQVQQIQELLTLNDMLRKDIQNKNELIVQLETEFENRQKNPHQEAAESMKIEYLLNHIERLSKQLQNTTNNSQLSPTYHQQSVEPIRKLQPQNQTLNTEPYNLYTVTEKQSVENSFQQWPSKIHTSNVTNTPLNTQRQLQQNQSPRQSQQVGGYILRNSWQQ